VAREANFSPSEIRRIPDRASRCVELAGDPDAERFDGRDAGAVEKVFQECIDECSHLLGFGSASDGSPLRRRDLPFGVE